MISIGLTAVLVLQDPTAALTGVVRDGGSGRPLVGAVVTLPESGRTETTDRLGRYRVTGVGSGPLHIQVRAIGFRPQTLHALVPAAGVVEINVTLDPAPTRLPPIDVLAARAAPNSQSDPPPPDRVVPRAGLIAHPLLAEPDGFLAVTGGVVSVRPESATGIHIRGAAADQTGYLLDGIPILSPYHAGGLFGGWNPEVLDQVAVTSSAASLDLAGVLGGVVGGTTRTPGVRLGASGSITTTHARVAIDGPLANDAGFLVGWRTGYPGFLAPAGEGSYLRGASGDWFAKAEGPALGGRWRVLGFGLEDELRAGSAVAPIEPDPIIPTNSFEWWSRSIGAEWSRSGTQTKVRWLSWTASSGAQTGWEAPNGRLQLVSAERDVGTLAVIERSDRRGSSSGAIRVNWSRTDYRIDSASSAGAKLNTDTPVVTAVANRREAVTGQLTLEAGATAAIGAGRAVFGPHLRLQWRLAAPVTASASYDRFHQHQQSLRNPESVAGAVFPVELNIGAGTAGVPVARSDLAIVAVDARLYPGARVTAQVYRRSSVGLALAAPRSADPFSAGDFVVGTGSTTGAAIDASMATARFVALASYGFQYTLLTAEGRRYRPDQGAAHTLDAGVIAFPSATSSVRLGLAVGGGRVGSESIGDLEWEACNLRDRGCEFGGSPRVDPATLGRTPLPGYVRLDLGVRRHWHVRFAGRDASVALFGTVSNLLGRRNLMAYVTDPRTGERSGIEMRPRGPLVIGLDWRF